MLTLQPYTDRRNPTIEYFRHMDLGLYKGDGNIENEIGSPKEILTRPGRVRLGFVATEFHPFQYMREVEFEARPGQRYWYSWACMPYPFVVVVEAATSRIVTMDAYCTDCDDLIGQFLSPENRCEGASKLEAPGRPIPQGGDLMEALQAWWLEYDNMLLWNACNAAESGLVGARLWLAKKYYLGDQNIPKDPVRAYLWSQLEADQQEREILANLYGDLYLTTRDSLTGDQLREADVLAENWRAGQCAREILGGWQPAYRIELIPEWQPALQVSQIKKKEGLISPTLAAYSGGGWSNRSSTSRIEPPPRSQPRSGRANSLTAAAATPWTWWYTSSCGRRPLARTCAITTGHRQIGSAITRTQPPYYL